MTENRAEAGALLKLRRFIVERELRVRGARVGRPRNADRPLRDRKGAYWPLLGLPPVLAPGDRAGARGFIARLQRVREAGGWSHSDRTYLAELERIWQRRADGEDLRFMVAGTRPGRLPRDVEQQLVLARQRYT